MALPSRPAAFSGCANASAAARAASIGVLRRSASASATSVAALGSGRGNHGGGSSGGGRGLGLDVEQDRRDVDARDAVDQAVVRLGDHREAPALDLVDEPDLPQRLRAVEALGEHAPGHVAQLLEARGRRQRGVADVVAGVEVAGRRSRPAAPGSAAGTRASGGSAARGAGASRAARGTSCSPAPGPRTAGTSRRACAPRRPRGRGRRRRARSGGRGSSSRPIVADPTLQHATAQPSTTCV